MGGGNAYQKSDFLVSSKWFYNWIEDSSIVAMQPEGPSLECPKCVKSGTFKIKPFDMENTPKSNQILGIHIPISTKYDPAWDSTYLYSYWLSYRSGANGLANGLSIHLTWFEMYTSSFGMYYDSKMYYAKGFSDEREDAVVKKGNCYHIAPSSYLKDQDLLAAEAVQPVVCVNDIKSGSNLEVSVSFLDPQDAVQPKTDLINYDVQCGSTSMTKTLDPSQKNLFHLTGTGQNGQFTLKLCNPDSFTQALFFDE